jgi:hypothetical protein
LKARGENHKFDVAQQKQFLRDAEDPRRRKSMRRVAAHDLKVIRRSLCVRRNIVLHTKFLGRSMHTGRAAMHQEKNN